VGAEIGAPHVHSTNQGLTLRLSREADWPAGVRAQDSGICRQKVEGIEIGAGRAGDREVRVKSGREPLGGP
jgi:hypothetical protein